MAVRIYFDTEFIENGSTIDLISIGMVKETGEEYYAISREFDSSKASTWVQKHVLSQLTPLKKTPKTYIGDRVSKYVDYGWQVHHPHRWRHQIASDILTFVGDDRPVFWAYYGAYDWIALAQIYGQMLQMPPRWPRHCRDIKQYADMIGSPRLPDKPEKEHHALADARWTKTAFDYLRGIEELQKSNTLYSV